jgi:hypothetical protein
MNTFIKKLAIPLDPELWLTLVIPTIWEAALSRIAVQRQPKLKLPRSHINHKMCTRWYTSVKPVIWEAAGRRIVH